MKQPITLIQNIKDSLLGELLMKILCRKILLLSMILLGFSACSGRSNHDLTSKILLGSIGDGLIPEKGKGGIKVFAFRDGTDEKILLTLNGERQTLELPRDAWTFYAIAWDGQLNLNGTSDQLSLFGDRRCAITHKNLTLNEEAITLNFSLDTCQLPEFIPKEKSFDIQIAKPANSQFCDTADELSIATIDEKGDFCIVSLSSVNGANDLGINPYKLLSAKIQYEQIHPGENPHGRKSACLDLSSDSDGQLQIIPLWTLLAGKHIQDTLFTIHFYDALNCADDSNTSSKTVYITKKDAYDAVYLHKTQAGIKTIAWVSSDLSTIQFTAP